MSANLELVSIDILKHKIKSLQTEVDTLAGKESYISLSIDKNKEKIQISIENKLLYTKATEFLHILEKATKEKIKGEFETLIEYALQYIFSKPYKAELEFGKRGNLSDLDFRIKSPECEEFVNPMNCNGGGVINVYEMALRIALLEMTKNPGFLVLDEKFKEVSCDYQPKVYEFLKYINKQLGRQIIFVTHAKTLIENAEYKIEIGTDK